MVFDPGLFEVDGALRDIVVLDADLATWQRMLGAVGGTGWLIEFDSTLADAGLESADLAERLFRRWDDEHDATVRLVVVVEGIAFHCYFFDVAVIEFTLDPADVHDDATFGVVVRFMRWLAGTCSRRVVMTMESTDHRGLPPLLECVP